MRKIALLAIALIAGLAIFMAFTMFGSKPQAHLSEEKKAQVLQRLKTLEMPFIENRGQTDERVAYYTKTFGGTLFITKEGELVYSFPKVEKAEKGKTPKVEGVAVIVERLSNAKVKELKALEKSPTNVSYFVGNDPKKWQTNIPTYRKVSLGEVYEGIKVELKSYGNNVEKLFYVSPGADPSKIRLELDGVKSAQVKESGELLLKTELGEIVFTKPVAYQEIGGKRVEVPVSYKVAKVDNKVVYGFEVKDYDKSKELVIDPLVQATYLGGSGNDAARAIVFDSSGNVYIAGATPHISGLDVFVMKLSGDLKTVIKATYFGGSNDDGALAIAIDNSGNIFVAGNTFSSDLPGTQGGAQANYKSGSEVFVAKLNGDLTNLIQSTYLGGSGGDYAEAISIDDSGNIYVAGSTFSTDFPATNYGFQTKNAGDSDVFVAMLSGDLKTIIVATYLGGSKYDDAEALALDKDSGSIYVIGITESTNFPGVADGAQPSFGGFKDAFIAKLNASLTNLIQSTYLGGSNLDGALAITLDSMGKIYVVGATYSTNFPGTAGGAQPNYGGGSDVFVAKFDSLSATSGNTGSVNTPNGQVNISIQNGTFTQPPQSQTNIPPLPSGFSAPYGAISFKAQVPQGATITITINFPQAIPQGAKLYKLINNQYIEVTNVQFAGNTATFQVQDGSSLDADG
ncbi:MAG: SBBP repeat-containing protein [Aquificaceae bacterium]|nr:SBBP repeat-containing protein [Aquificaceae bacterium]